MATKTAPAETLPVTIEDVYAARERIGGVWTWRESELRVSNAIVNVLGSAKELTPSEIARAVGRSVSRVSHVLSALRLADILTDPDRWANGALTDALLKLVREATSLDVKRTDFKLDMVPAHLFMNFRVVDEHGRQLGIGRNLAALKAELGSQARSAFQALAALKLNAPEPVAPAASQAASGGVRAEVKAAPRAAQPSTADGSAKYTAWDFGELPELMEVKRGSQSLIGFPALIDKGVPPIYPQFWQAMREAGHRRGMDSAWARKVPQLLQQQGLQHVGADVDVPFFNGGSSAAEFWRLTAEQLLPQMESHGLLTRHELTETIMLMRNPSIWLYGPAMVAIWGQRPAV